MFVAECPEVGIDQGVNFEAAIAHLQETTKLYLEEFFLPENISPRLVNSHEVTLA
jgi:hypothetical protein